MIRNIAVFTGTRAEYGLLSQLMKGIESSDSLHLRLIVSGTHLSAEFGETWRQIEDDGFLIDAKVEMLLSSDSDVGVVKSMGLGTIGFADALDRMRPDMLVVLGDRFEALAIVQAALIMRIPVAHLHGGEITEGAYDDSIRHAITKMSSLHFTATEVYRSRVIQMGEQQDSVFNVGAIGLDSLLSGELMTLSDLGDSLGFCLRSPFLLLTYHPATSSDEDPEKCLAEILMAIDEFPDYQVLITYPNADNGGRSMIPLLREYVRTRNTRAMVVPSLGFARYQSALSHASVVIGNSSSGIIEAPSFRVPSINVGIRQKGRLAATSVLHCDTTKKSILVALKKALSESFRSSCEHVVNPYGQGNAANQIIPIIEQYVPKNSKRFNDAGAEL